ncbi:MAG: hypothetical protein AAF720_07795 [Pseudomonadota bacterium]
MFSIRLTAPSDELKTMATRLPIGFTVWPESGGQLVGVYQYSVYTRIAVYMRQSSFKKSKREKQGYFIADRSLSSLTKRRGLLVPSRYSGMQ